MADTRRPSQSRLDLLFERVDRARIIDGGVSGGQALGDEVLLELGTQEIPRLREGLRIVEGVPSFHCMCLGDLAIELRQGEQLSATIGLHHGISIRLEGWDSDAPLADGETLLRWLAQRGVERPLADWEASRARQAEGRRAQENWFAAMPACLRPHMEALSDPFSARSKKKAREDPYGAAKAVLLETYSTEGDAAAAVLRWFATGAGPWSGFPAYEGAAEEVLRRLGSRAVLAAIEAAACDAAVELGAARYFAAWELQRSQRADFALVPRMVRARLLERARKTGSRDNVQRLEAAFAPRPPVAVKSRRQVELLGRTANGPARGVWVGADGAVFALDAYDLVAFDPGSTAPRALARLEATAVQLGADEGFVYVADINAGTIARIARGGGSLEPIATACERPMHPFVHEQWLYWLDSPFITDPVKGPPYSVSVAAVKRLPLRDGGCGEPEVVTRLSVGGWDLVAGPDGLFLAAVIEPRRPTLVRIPSEGGPPEPLFRLQDGGPLTSLRIVADDRAIYWYDGDRSAFLRWPMSGGEPEQYAESKPPILPPAAGGCGLVFAREGRFNKKTLYHAPPDGGTPRKLASWRSPPYDRPQLAVRGSRVFYTSDDCVFSATIA